MLLIFTQQNQVSTSSEMSITKILKKLNGLCFYLDKINFKACSKFKTFKHFIIILYLSQNKIHQLCKLLSKIELIKKNFCKNSCIQSKIF